MAEYRSPGVYVEEVPSAVQPIAGVGTSTVGFIGVFEGQCIFDEEVGHADNPQNEFSLRHRPKAGSAWIVKVGSQIYRGTVGEASSEGVELDAGKQKIRFGHAPPSDEITVTYTYKDNNEDQNTTESIGNADNATTEFPKSAATLQHEPKTGSKWTVKVGSRTYKGKVGEKSKEVELDANKKKVMFDEPPESDAILVSYCADEASDPYTVIYKEVTEELKAQTDGQTMFLLQNSPVLDGSGNVKERKDIKVELKNDSPKLGQSSAVLTPGLSKKGDAVTLTYTPIFKTVRANEVKLCTNFGEFKKSFGDFSLCPSHNHLVHAVYGFFNNGGTRCYVVWEKSKNDITNSLQKLEAIDEIAIVAAPGITDSGARDEIVTHCAQTTQDRFAIFDSDPDFDPASPNNVPPNSNYAAFYAPWIQVSDPATGAKIQVPPSGHLAGIYARVDANRGVHKAPANEVVLGALGLKPNISKAQQEGLNPHGINCIRDLNGNIRVWGARTIGGDANLEWKYVNVRRLFLYLRKSIEQGTQWVVFEPNDPALWAKISRNVAAFLTNVWRDGALFGATPQQAFYVKCDAETNPPELRDQGQVVTEIGVAVVKPAEFVVFRVSQWAGPGG
jgi:phage tail sheath protein FI